MMSLRLQQSPHLKRAACLLTMVSLYSLSHADPMAGQQRLAENIVLDNSDASEVLITNTEEVNVPADQAAIKHQRQLQRWQSGHLPYQSEVQAAAQATRLDPALIHAVIATESAYNPQALSRKGAYGLMQVLPTTALTLTAVPVRQWSVPQQIWWGSHYLKQMLDMFEGNVTLALAAYNAGPQAVKAHQHAVPPYAETKKYVPKVLGYYHVFQSRLNQPSD